MAAEDWLAEDPDLAWRRNQLVRTFPQLNGPSFFQKQPGMPKNHGYFWTSTQDGVLKAYYRNKLPIATIAREMGRTENSITSRLKVLGLTDTWGGEILLEDQPLKGTNFVNLIHAITLLQEGYTTLEVTYPGNTQHYTFKVANTLRERLKEDDHVVVFTKDEFKVVKVRKIHDKPQIDVKAPFELKWIVCRVERETYDDQVKREAEAVEKIATAERRQAADEALKVLFAQVGSREELLALINPR